MSWLSNSKPDLSAGDASTNDLYAVPMKTVPKKYTIKELSEVMKDNERVSRRYQQEFSVGRYALCRLVKLTEINICNCIRLYDKVL